MRKHYDFSKAKANPYAKRLKKNIHIRIDEDVIKYFQGLADKEGIPYQTLMNAFLRDCAHKKKEIHIKWD
jgi:uncharacterized protein (DUF4415 family)